MHENKKANIPHCPNKNSQQQSPRIVQPGMLNCPILCSSQAKHNSNEVDIASTPLATSNLTPMRSLNTEMAVSP